MEDVILSVRLTPRGGRDAVIGAKDGVVHLRVAAPPVEGRANRACAALVASALKVRPGQVTLLSGETSRSKRFAVSGVAPEETAHWLATLPSLSGE